MVITYIEEECPYCKELKIFQEFSSFTGKYKRCPECGYAIFEIEKEYKIPTPWEIINS